MIRLSFYFLMVALLAACASTNRASNPAELARTLDKAIVAIPVSKYSKNFDSESNYADVYDKFWQVKNEIAKIPDEAKIPLVIYMHGCSGIGFRERVHIRFLFDNNYAVLAPDSFARDYKPKSCNPYSRTGGLHRGVLRFRLAEARFAHEFAKTLPWVDKQNIFLMGFSQGGITTARYGQGGLAGRVILGWTCNSGWTEYRGIVGPRDEPILAVVSQKDPWYSAFWVHGHCGMFMASRKNSESVVLDGTFHDVLALLGVQEKVIQFLRAHTHSSKPIDE